MLPEPLHPAVVHFPIVLAALLPLFALGSLLVIRRGAHPTRSWLLVVALAAGLAGSAWLATETGEEQEEIVEEVVAEQAIETHEEAAELFLILSGVVLAVSVAGLVRGGIGSAARMLGTASALVLVIAGWNVGRSGGELVYEHGAASAYVQASGGTGAEANPYGRPGGESEERDEREREGR